MARGKATFDTMPTVDVESNLRVSPTVDVSNRVNPDMRSMNPARSLDGELDDLASSLELDPVQMRAHEKEVVRGGYGDYKHLPKKSLDDEMMVFKGGSFLDDVEEKGASGSLQRLVKERVSRANLTTLRTRGNLRKDLREVVRGTKGRAESIHPEAESRYRVKELSSNIVVKEQEAVPVGLAIRDLRRLDRMTNYLKKRGQQYETYDEEPMQEDKVQPKELSDGMVVTKGAWDLLQKPVKNMKTLAKQGMKNPAWRDKMDQELHGSILAGRQARGQHLTGRRPDSWDKPVKGLDDEMMVFKGPQFAHRVKQTVTSRQHMKDLMKKKGFEEDLEVKFAKKLVQGAKNALNKVIKPKSVPVAPRTAGTNVFRSSTKPAADFHVDPKGTATASAPPKAAPTEKPPTTQANQKKPDTGPGTAAGTDYQKPPVTTGQVKGKKRVDPTNPPRKPLSKPVKYGLIGGGLLGVGYGASQLMQNSEPEYPQPMGYQEYKGDIQQKAFKCVMRPESRPDLHAALAKIGKLKTRS